MMEIKLIFEEEKFLEIHADTLMAQKKSAQKKNNERKATAVGLLALSLLSCFLAYEHPSWWALTVGFSVCVVVTLLFLWQDAKEEKNEYRKQEEKGLRWIERYKAIGDIRYKFKEGIIEYFEDGVMVGTYDTDRISTVRSDEEYIFVYFEKPEAMIWFPKFTVVEQDFEALRGFFAAYATAAGES